MSCLPRARSSENACMEAVAVTARWEPEDEPFFREWSARRPGEKRSLARARLFGDALGLDWEGLPSTLTVVGQQGKRNGCGPCDGGSPRSRAARRDDRQPGVSARTANESAWAATPCGRDQYRRSRASREAALEQLPDARRRLPLADGCVHDRRSLLPGAVAASTRSSSRKVSAARATRSRSCRRSGSQ